MALGEEQEEIEGRRGPQSGSSLGERCSQGRFRVRGYKGGVQGEGRGQHQANGGFQGEEAGSPQSQLRARLPGWEEEVSGLESAIKSLQSDL